MSEFWSTHNLDQHSYLSKFGKYSKDCWTTFTYYNCKTVKIISCKKIRITV